MGHDGFDAFTRALALGTSRRHLLQVLAGLVLPVSVARTWSPARHSAYAHPAVSPWQPAESGDSRYFPETDFRVDDESIWEYFQAKGGVSALGYPVSRAFTLLGCRVQIFQRGIVQHCSDNVPMLLNLLDPDVFPYTRVNGGTFPAPDEALIAAAPKVDQPDYAERMLEFVQANVPNEWDGQAVEFGRTFFGSIPAERADTQGTSTVALLALEVWGAPISRPARDPGNAEFIYQRFQRGIMHFQASRGVTEGILLADYFKAVLLGPDLAGTRLPADLREQARGSRFFAQYCPGSPLWVCRPDDLAGSDMTAAFEGTSAPALNGKPNTPAASASSSLQGTPEPDVQTPPNCVSAPRVLPPAVRENVFTGSCTAFYNYIAGHGLIWYQPEVPYSSRVYQQCQQLNPPGKHRVIMGQTTVKWSCAANPDKLLNSIVRKTVRLHCACTDKSYSESELQKCQAECHPSGATVVNPKCFTGICAPVSDSEVCLSTDSIDVSLKVDSGDLQVYTLIWNDTGQCRRLADDWNTHVRQHEQHHVQDINDAVKNEVPNVLKQRFEACGPDEQTALANLRAKMGADADVQTFCANMVLTIDQETIAKGREFDAEERRKGYGPPDCSKCS